MTDHQNDRREKTIDETWRCSFLERLNQASCDDAPYILCHLGKLADLTLDEVEGDNDGPYHSTER